MYSICMHALYIYPSDVSVVFLCFTLKEHDLDEQIMQTKFNHPYIAVIEMDYTINMFLVVEREIVCSVKSVFQAVKVLLASYYLI